MKAEAMREQGFAVDFQQNSSPRPSVRLRTEGKKKVSEIIVWDDANTHEAIVDLTSGDFIHERDGYRLQSDWAHQLADFFVLAGDESSNT